MRPRKTPGSVGGLLIFAALAVLVLAVFAALTLSAALADLRLSQKNAEMTALYYTLDSRGEALLARLEAPLAMVQSAQAARAALALAGEPGDALRLIPEGDALRLEAELAGEDGRALHLAARLRAEGGWRVLRWRMSPPEHPPESLDLGRDILQ